MATLPPRSIAIGTAIQFQDDGPTAAIVADRRQRCDGRVARVWMRSIRNAADYDNVAANPFPAGYGTPIGLLSNVDLVNTTTTTGADNEGATTAVTLSIVGGIRTDSRLQTTDNRQISLFNESGVIVGRMDTAGGVADPAGTVAFAISINNAGEVTVAQYLSLEHPTPGASYDEAVNLGSLVNAVVTVTDGDGDVATQIDRHRQRDPVPGRRPDGGDRPDRRQRCDGRVARVGCARSDAATDDNVAPIRSRRATARRSGCCRTSTW